MVGQPASRQNVQVFYLGSPEPPQITPQQRQEFRQSIGVDADTPLVVHVGSFSPKKNHPAVIEIFADLHKKLPDTRLVLVGDGAARPTIEQLVTDQALENAVFFLGLRDDVPRIMQSSDVLLLPSTHEGLPIVVMEAKASRLPIVASDIPSIREALGEGRTGRMLPLGNVTGFVDALVEVLQDSAVRSELTDNARRRYDEMFSLESAKTRLANLYEECLGARENNGARRDG